MDSFLFLENELPKLYASLYSLEVIKSFVSFIKLSFSLKFMTLDEHPLKSDFVIQNRYGLVINPRNISMEFTKKVQKYKQLTQITFHGLRHTHDTILIANSENIKVVSERLGHKDITTTLETYTHVMEEMEQNTSNILENMFTGLVP